MLKKIIILYLLIAVSPLLASTKVSQGNLSELYSNNQCNRQGNFYIICDNSKEVSKRMKEKLNIHHKNRVISKDSAHISISPIKNKTNHQRINHNTNENISQQKSFITMTNKIANYQNKL